MVKAGIILPLLATAALLAHPMGNFSINHYARLQPRGEGVRLTYILDLAEIPTLELLQQWQVSGRSRSEIQDSVLHARAEAWTPELLANLSVEVDGRRLEARVRGVSAQLLEGAGGMPTTRIVIDADFPTRPGLLTYEDRNYASRTGWKEIVVRGGEDVKVAAGAFSQVDLSHELTVYPSDLSAAPPQDLRASLSWTAMPMAPVQAAKKDPKRLSPALPARPTPAVAVQVPSIQPAVRSFSSQQQAAGTVAAGDFLSRMFQKQQFGPGMILLGILVAFSLGATHALSPGHGKTIVAAYLVGSRGNLKHALLLGLTVTFTHTVSVFLLGIGVLLFQRSFMPERAVPILGTISGLCIVATGAWLFYKRAQALRAIGGHGHDGHGHHHHEHHSHDGHSHAHGAHHEGGSGAAFTHTHDGHTHTHAVPEGKIGLGSLLALGVSGGLVPCPSALILLLSAIALGRTATGLILLLGFSAGLALVLIAVGALVLYAKQLLPLGRLTSRHSAFRFIPVLSAVVVIVLGLVMTLTAAGIVSPIRFLV